MVNTPNEPVVNPQKTSYEELVALMAKHDLALAKREAAAQKAQ